MSMTRKALYGATVAMVLLLFALPTTSWLVRIETGITGLRQVMGMRYDAPDGALLRTAAHHPADFDTQFAAALVAGQYQTAQPPTPPDTTWGNRMVSRMGALLPQFGNNPALLAAYLRYSTQSDVMIRRDDDEKLLSPDFRSYRTAKGAIVPKNDPAKFAEFEAVAARGERLDPNNSYFPMMHAVALFAAHQDDAAVAAILRAGKMTRWDSYLLAETNARQKLVTQTYGEPGGIARLAVDAGILLPDFAQQRAAARITIVRAFQLEQEGRTEDGFALRHALARIGAQMRVDSSLLIGNLVGQAIIQVAGGRPGGAPPIPGREQSKRSAETAAAYTAYLNQIGHPEEARWFETERGIAKQNRVWVNKAMDLAPMGGKSMVNLLLWWGIGMFLLINIAALLVLAIPAALLARTRWIKDGKPLPLYIPVGFWSGIAALLPFGLLEVGVPLQLLAGLIIVLLGTFPIWIRSGGGKMFRGIVAGFLTFAVVGIGGGAIVGAVASPNGFFGFVHELGLFLQSTSDNSVGMPTAQAAFLLALVGIVPLLLLLSLTIFSLIVRVPISVGIVRGVRGIAPPLACGLILVYGIVLFGTAQQERHFKSELHKQEQHEGRYLAALVGEKWAGATR